MFFVVRHPRRLQTTVRLMRLLCWGLPIALSGGFRNRATSEHASVSGGSANLALETSAWVMGGFDNVASSSFASECGGGVNEANNASASVSGGYGKQCRWRRFLAWGLEQPSHK